MLPPRHSNSRFFRSARAAYVARMMAAGALVVVPAACGGNGDEDVFGASSTVAEPSAAAPVTATAQAMSDDVAETGGTTPTTAAAATATTAATTATSVPAATGPTFPSGAEMVVDFTFAAESSDGRVRNPYVAVWVEDAAGNYVSTIAVWYEQGGKGTRWLNDLRAWATASSGQVSDTSTGATRSPGSYSVVWNGTDVDGNPVAQGDYVLFVEAAREHGPYEITSSPITIGDAGFSVTLADNGELSALSATLTV